MIKDVTEIMAASVGQFALSSMRQHGLAPKMDPHAQLARYVHWAYVCIDRNAVEIGRAKLRLFATRQTGQQRVGKGLGLHIPARVLSKSEVADLRNRFTKIVEIQTAQEIEEIFDHPFLTMMKTVNPRHNEFDLWRLTETYKGLMGNAFWWLEDDEVLGIPKRIWPLATQFMRIVPGKMGTDEVVQGYLYGRQALNQIRFEASEVVQYRDPNPADPYLWGRGPMAAGAAGVDRYTYFDGYENSLLQRNGIPDFLVKYKHQINPKQRKELEEEWNQAIEGSTKHRRIKVADEDWDIEKLTFSPQEMSYLAGRKWTREEICGIYNVPLPLVTSEGVNRAQLFGAMVQFTRFSILPRLRQYEDSINQDIIPRYDEPRLFAAFDNPVPEDKEFQLKRDMTDLKYQLYSVNEVRRRRGDDAAPWGNEPLANINIVPISTPPAKTNQAASDPPQKMLKAASDDLRTGGPNPRISPNEAKLIAVVEGIWREQEQETLRLLDEGHKGFDVKAEEQVLFDFDSYVQQMSALSKPILADVFARGGAEGWAEINLAAAPGWVEIPEVIEAIEKTSFKFATKVNKTVSDRLREQLTAGHLAGEGIPQLKNRMSEVFTGLVQAKHAEAIARSETARVFRDGKVIAWKQSGVVTGKIWDAAEDACPFCRGLHGQVVELDAAFADPETGNALNEGYEYVVDFGASADAETRPILLKLDYETVTGPPLHVSCRCTLRPDVITA